MTKKQKLEAIVKNEQNSIRAYVAQDLLDADSIEGYLQDLMQGGCQSGQVSGLIYYKDTLEFYNEYVDEIDEIKGELEDALGGAISIGTPSYNWLTWFGYEETARKIADELGIGV